MSIGIENLPPYVTASEVLSQEDLLRLSHIEQLPTTDQLSTIKASPDVKRILDEFDNPSQCRDALHGLAQQYLLMDELERALAIVML